MIESANAGDNTHVFLPFGGKTGMISPMSAKPTTAKLAEDARGVFIIAATPFSDEGALDLRSVDTLTDFYLGCGVHGFTLLGMMGEAHKLTPEESLAVVQRVVARAKDRQVIVGVSHAGLENVRRLAHQAMVAGASGVMVAPPSGLRGDEGVYNYFAQVFQELGPDIPVVYQDYPQSTGVYLAPWVLESLVDDFEQLVMLKHEDAPGLAKLTRIRDGEKKEGRRRLSILVGNGGLYLPQELRRGADGAMTGFAWPEMLVEVYELFAAGKPEEAEDLFDLYLPLVRHEQQPAIGLALRKEVLFRRGAIRSPRQRTPGSSLSTTDHAELDNLMARLDRRLAAAGRATRLAAE
jgi:4-hydroxy-tetrahydrodipicolinate synthase